MYIDDNKLVRLIDITAYYIASSNSSMSKSVCALCNGMLGLKRESTEYGRRHTVDDNDCGLRALWFETWVAQARERSEIIVAQGSGIHISPHFRALTSLLSLLLS